MRTRFGHFNFIYNWVLFSRRPFIGTVQFLPRVHHLAVWELFLTSAKGQLVFMGHRDPTKIRINLMGSQSLHKFPVVSSSPLPLIVKYEDSFIIHFGSGRDSNMKWCPQLIVLIWRTVRMTHSTADIQ